VKKIVILGAVVAVAAFTLTGCDALTKYTEPFQDAPRTATSDTSAAQVITMPDGFSNLATKCVGGMRYTVAYHGDNAYGAISVVADPKCTR
jgi:predicted RecA/RadA family phage recombinase